MKKLGKNTIYAILGILLLNLNYVNAEIIVNKGSTAVNLSNTQDGDFVATIELMVGYIVGLLYLIAIIFGLYAGFQILTAGGDEEKVKKGKTTMINVAIGLIVIFLSSSIINWLITQLSGGALVTAG